MFQMNFKPGVLKNFIVFEGLDGAGTTTQAKLLANLFAEHKILCRVDCEPTKGFIGKTIRKVLKGKEKVSPGTLALLFAADRHEHLYNKNDGVVTLCSQNIRIISDRYLFSSLAYQSLAYGFEGVFDINKPFPLPEHLFFLEVPSEVCQQRLTERNELEIFEKESIQKEIVNNYNKALGIYEGKGMKIHHIDGTLAPDDISKIVWRLLAVSPTMNR